MGNSSSTSASSHDDTLNFVSSRDSENETLIFQRRNQHQTTAALSKTSHIYSSSIPSSQTSIYKSLENILQNYQQTYITTDSTDVSANILQNYRQTYITTDSTAVSAQPSTSYNTSYNNNNKPKAIIPPSVSSSAQTNLSYNNNNQPKVIVRPSISSSAQPNSLYNTVNNSHQQRIIAPPSSASSAQSSTSTLVLPSSSSSAQPNSLYNTVNNSHQQRIIAPPSSASSAQSKSSTLTSNVQNQTPIKHAPTLNVINPKKLTSSKSTHNSSTDAKIVNCSQKSGICLKFLKGPCEYGFGCRFLHNNRPYLWVYYYHKTWYECSDQHDIENSYCDPLQEGYSMNFNPSGNSIKQDIIFKDDDTNFFTCNDYTVYRFSTPSYGSTKRRNNFYTKWQWYWKINAFFWNELSLESGCSISSLSFEKEFLLMESDFIEYTINTVPFQLDFCSFKQIDLETGKYWDIRRRPKKLTAEEVQVLQNMVVIVNPSNTSIPGKRRKKRSTNTLPISIANDFGGKPVQWKTTGEDPKQYLQKINPAKNWEFSKVKRLMNKTIPGVYIKSLHRIENKKLNQSFSLKRHQMISDLTEKGLNERLLFHGCPESCIDSICHQGFDFRLSGERTGTLYGWGAYFASKASYSHNYSEVNAAGYNRMFIAKVLVGCSVLGKPQYVRPPSINGGNELYDSCVDNQNSPTIFVIFNLAQAYPQYLVTYSLN